MNGSWQELTPAELLAANEVLTMTEAAYVLRLCHRQKSAKGKPNPALVRELVAAGKLRLVDPDLPQAYWTVSAETVRRYRDGSPQRQPRSIGAA